MCNAYPSCSSTQLTPSEFVSQYGDFAKWASYLLGWPVAIILAQWSIESNWGMADICAPYYNPGNTQTGSTLNKYSSLCVGVQNGYVAWAQNNYSHEGSNETYDNLISNAYELGYTIPSSNNYGCLPGAGMVFEGPYGGQSGLQAACAALGSSGWARSDYCYCSAGDGTACCTAGNYAGQTLYYRATNDFGSYNYIQSGSSTPSCC